MQSVLEEPARLSLARVLVAPVAGELDSPPLPRTPAALDDTVPDGDLARAVTEGVGEEAEARLVARYGKRVFLYGMRHLRDESQASDLAQDVMISVIERLREGSVREPDRIGSFILGTARWMCHDARRRERRAVEVMKRAAHEIDVVVEPPEPVDAEQLSEALGTLSERERTVLILSFHEGRSAREIGEVFDLKPGHVRVLRHRALGRLGEILGVSQLDQRTEGT